MTREGGGGWLRNYNAHGIDLLRYIVGEFGAVAGSVHPGSDRGMTSDDSYSFAFVMENGAQGAMTGTCRTWEPFALTRITGSDAGIDITGETGPAERFRRLIGTMAAVVQPDG